MGHFKYYPNLFVMLVGPAGRCRKGTALSAATSLLRELPDNEDGKPKIHISANSTTRAALIREIAQSQRDIQIGGQRYTHASLTVVSAEFMSFFSSVRGSENLDMVSLLTDLFDCHNRWEYKTKHAGTDIITGVCLNLLAASTPDWLVGSVPMVAIGGGFTSRVIFVVEYDVRHRMAFPKLTEPMQQARAHLVEDLNTIAEMTGEVRLTPKAAEFFEHWYMRDNVRFTDPRFAGYSERKQVHLMKLSLLLALAEKRFDGEIEPRHLQAGLKYLHRLEGNMVEAFGGAGRSPEAADIAWMLEALEGEPGGMSYQNLVKLTLRDISVRAFDAVLAQVVRAGAVISENKGGTQWYRYNPEFSMGSSDELVSDDTRGEAYT
jgi:hypothetical protein